MPRPSRRYVVYGLLFFASVAFLLYSLRGAGPRVDAGDALAAGRATDAEVQQVAAAIPAAVPDNVDLSRYEDLARTNIFSSRRSAPSPPPKQTKAPVPPPPPFNRQDALPPSSTAIKQPDFAGWTYTGYIVRDGKKIALLQNDSSESGRDVAVGESFLGATVVEVTGREIRLKSGGRVTTLSIPELFPLVPLDKSASATKVPQPGRSR